MNSEYTIRVANSADVPDLIALLKLLFSIESDFEFDQYKQQKGLELMIEKNDNNCVLVAEKNCQLLGMCTVQILLSTAEGGKVALIEDLVVAAKCRRKGIGKSLLLSIEKWAAEKGVRRLQLLADRKNILALQFYKKMNWKQTQLICLHKK